MNRFPILIVTVCLLTGCMDETTKSVAWYQQHQDERGLKLDACSNDHRKLKDTPNCRNAAEAERLATIVRTPLNW
ncbi:MAG: EexN family lipoprotein [Gammaproteobacteria bacterium]|nr:EexN family lipoprotein [Gammaproteobacteria bacterium]